MLLALAIILFIGLVIVHEWGHFIAARRNGVDVEEFGIGFPPKAKTLARKNGTEYTLNWLPLGGFVRLKGEHDSDKTKGSFGAASLWAKTKIMLAGVVMNLLAAVVIFTGLAFVGMPQLVDNQFGVDSYKTIVRDDVVVGGAVSESPASKAGLESGDILVSINGKAIAEHSQVSELTSNFAGQEVAVVYLRGDDKITANVLLNQDSETLNSQNEKQGNLGVINPGSIKVARYGLAAPLVGVGTTVQLTGLTYQGLGSLLASVFTADFSTAADSVSGPIGVVSIFSIIDNLGILFILFFIGVISLTLAIMNALPIPALDGGRLFVTLLYRALRKPLTKRTEEIIHGTGFVALMLLFVLISIVDVKRFL